ncbi:MAG: hypothetical protein AAGC70_01790 [Pseudomonadota bacterium]
MFVGFSLLSAFGFAASKRIGKAGEQAALNAELGRVQDRKDRLQKRLASLPGHRPTAVVQEAIAAAQQHLRWQSTKGCTDATVPDSRRFCAACYRLIGELAAAKQADDIRRQIRKLTAHRNTLAAKGAGRTVDSQSQLLSSILGLGSDRVQLVLITTLALVVEFGSSLGLYLATSHSPVLQRRTPQAEPAAITLDARPVGSVVAYCHDRLHPAANGNVTVSCLFADYQSWCDAHGFHPRDREDFQKRTAEIAAHVGLDKMLDGFAGVAIGASTLKQIEGSST